MKFSTKKTQVRQQHTYMGKYNALSSFARLCEYMYRRGVKDGADIGEIGIIEAFLEENSPTRDFCFLSEGEGRKMKLNYYCTILSYELFKMRARNGADIFDNVLSSNNLRLGAAAVAYSFYRKGLQEGAGTDIGVAHDYFYSDPYFKAHERLSGKNINRRDMIECMRLEALRLDDGGFKQGYTIWKFIGEGLAEKYASDSERNNSFGSEV